MSRLFAFFLGTRLWPLVLKELRQIKRNRRLVISLIVPPTLQIVLFGFALNPEVTNLRLGVVDESGTAASRELLSAFVESRAFRVERTYASSAEVGAALSAGEIDGALVIPADFARDRERGRTASVQLLLDAVNANTAAIAGGYSIQIIAALNQKILRDERHAPVMSAPQAVGAIDDPLAPAPGTPVAVAPSGLDRATLATRVKLLYNPGLINAWFIVTGTLGTLLVLNGSLVAAASMVKEREMGTVEQLLMTPAEATEIIAAKIAPLFLLLSGTQVLALLVGYVVFGVPVRGSLLLLFTAGSMCVLAGIGIGTTIATFAKSQQQAQLMSFFVNPPIAMLSGALTPVEAMPKWMQPITWANPVRHFSIISRGVMLKGTGLDILYPHLLALAAFAIVLVGISVWRFRRQLG